MKDDTIAFISGGGLSFWDLKKNDRDAVWSERNGFSKVATNHKHGVFACAEHGVNPSVMVYSYPSKEVLHSFTDICRLEVLDLVISRDGKRMIAVAGVPDYQIKYFDIENGINYDMVPCKVTKDFIKVIFHPANNETFIIINKQSVVYCEVKAIYDVSEEEQTKVVRYQIETKTYNKPKENLPVEFVDAVYDTREKLYVTDTMCRIHILHMEDFKKEFPVIVEQESIVDNEHMTDKYPIFRRDDQNNLNENEEEEIPLVRSDVFNVGSQVNSMILTRKHLIIANDDDNIEWYVLDKKQGDDKKEKEGFDLRGSSGELEKETEYHFGETTTQKIVKMHYNHIMDTIYIATENGNLYAFPFKAEVNADEDEEFGEEQAEKNAEEEEEDEQKEIDVNIENVGFSHSKAVTFIKELPNSSLIVSGGMDGKIIVWNGYDGSYINEYVSESDLTCGDINPAGSLLVVGSTKGAVKLFDITNRSLIRLVHYKKISKKEKPITEVKFSLDGSLICVGTGSKKLFFLYGNPSTGFRVLGKLKFQVPVNSFCWTASDKMPNGAPGILAVSEGLLFAVSSPSLNENYHNKELDYEICPMYCRRIDFSLDKIAVIDSTGEVFLTGKDKFLKKYKIPDELVAKTNPGVKAPPSPLEELNGHPLPANVCFTSHNSQFLVSGAQDGSICVREIANLTKPTHFKAHNFKSNGVSALEMGREVGIIYSGGFEGSLFSWMADEDAETPERENPMKIDDPEVEDLEELEDNFDEDIMHYERVIEEDEYQAQEEERERVKGELRDELEQIRDKLRELLLANDYADELEKLDRGDFCIDIESRDKIQREGTEKKDKMKNEARREVLKSELLYGKIKEKAWDTMDTHLKALVGLTSNNIVFNFHVRTRTEQELRKLQLVLDHREMERKEKLAREQKAEKEVVDVESFCKKPDAYIINGVPGYKPLVLVDYEAKEEIAEIKKEGKDERQDGRRREMAPRVVRGKPQATQAKTEDKKENDDDKKNEEAQKSEKEKNENPAWNNLYGAFELVTNNRKRNQIVIMKDLIFKIKERFNKEFELLSAERQRLIDTINEKNNRIKEIYETLKYDNELFKARVNPLENPERVLKVDPEEVGFERYLTKEEREKLEEERKKEEERIRLLNADDAGVRAVKQMMGGTLEEKKETPLTEELVREEWMNKPPEDMDDDERVKFAEFEAKESLVKEEREKIRKNLELELRKLKNEIKEICEKFDEKMFVLYRRRLEYEYRVQEQELYIVKLTLSMLIEDDNVARREEYIREYEDLVQKEAVIRDHLGRLDELRRGTEEDKTRKEVEYKDAIKADAKIKQFYTQIFEKEDKKNNREKWADDPRFQSQLVKLDPFFELDKLDVKKEVNSDFFSYEEEIEKSLEAYKTTTDMSDETKRRYIEAFRNKFSLKKELDKFEREYKDIMYYMTLKDKERREFEEKSRKKERHVNYLETQLAIAISDLELQLRFNQGQVEIPQDEPVPRLADAILINRTLIEHKNKEIRERGRKKTDQMGVNMKTEFDKKKLEHQKLLLDWELNDLNIKTKEVHNLKLRKEMQIALTKKDQDHNQAELMKLTKQSQLLKDATEKRIEIYRKKEEKVKREINSLQGENQQLNKQGHDLGLVVKQRSDINEMMNRKNNEDNTNGEKKEFKKFKEISANKRYFELAKKQTEEIELLREELNRLKAKTFANFTNQSTRF